MTTNEAAERHCYAVPTGYGFVTYSPVPGGGWFSSRFPNRAIAEKWAARQREHVEWTAEDFYGRLPWERDERNDAMRNEAEGRKP